MTERPFPPGDYPVIVIGSGPGGIQASSELRRLGIGHALLSADEAPGGMFQRFPLFQRLITWTKLYAPAERGTRAYEWYDWNSLLPAAPEDAALVAGFMDGSSYFPTRGEMEQGLGAFVDRTKVAVRYGCRWGSTRRTDDGFVVATSDGEYRAPVLIIAVGMTQPWRPEIPGIESVPHYIDTDEVAGYAGKRVFVIGKRNSGFEIATALLPVARQIILGSPRPARISVLTHSTAAARARYLQPYEDHVLSGGNVVLDCAIERVESLPGGRYRVHAAGTTKPGRLTLDVDAVIAATGFTTPLLDLPDLGVVTFHQGRLPAQTPFWESTSVPGIYFAGSITQGAVGLRRYGSTSNSAAVHGFRYNARVLAEHLARERNGNAPARPPVARGDVVGYLLDEATRAPELWNQQAYLARVLSVSASEGIRDEGIQPLAHFVDAAGPDAIAVTVETDGEGDIHPAVYLRRDGRVEEHLLPPDPLMDFETGEHRAQLGSVLKYWTD